MKTELREVKKLRILSIAKIALIFGIVFGLFQGIGAGLAAKQTLVTYPDLANLSFSDPSVVGNPQMVFSLIVIKMGWWNILAMPIVLAFVWWLAALISAWIYNLIAKKFGGIKLELA
ncbi:Uncharacterised protein [uncultured archaeon]|nr:Uncharacterised protein [uncultured archaeon]